MADDKAARRQPFIDRAQAEREAEIQPNRVDALAHVPKGPHTMAQADQRWNPAAVTKQASVAARLVERCQALE
jgi:hypothetical protein